MVLEWTPHEQDRHNWSQPINKKNGSQGEQLNALLQVINNLTSMTQDKWELGDWFCFDRKFIQIERCSSAAHWLRRSHNKSKYNSKWLWRVRKELCVDLTRGSIKLTDLTLRVNIIQIQCSLRSRVCSDQQRLRGCVNLTASHNTRITSTCRVSCPARPAQFWLQQTCSNLQRHYFGLLNKILLFINPGLFMSVYPSFSLTSF